MARKEFIIVLTGIFLCGLGVFALLSLLTYTPESDDPASPDQRGNLCGSAGAVLSYGLLQTFGASAFVLPVLLGFWTWLLWFGRPVPRVWLKVAGSIILIFVCAALENLVSPRSSVFSDIAFGGGVAGFTIHRHVLDIWGLFGAWALSVMFLAVGLLFVTDEAGIGAVRGLARACVRGVSALRGWLAAKAVARKERRLLRRSARRVRKKVEAVVDAGAKPARPAAKREAPERPPEPAPVAAVSAEKPPTDRQYRLPSLDLLEEPGQVSQTGARSFIQQSIETLNRALEDFGVDAAVVDYRRGPAVTMFEIELAPGVKVHRVMALSNDLAMRLKVSGLRVVAPIPGKSTVGIEVPNSVKELVRLKEVLQSEIMKDSIFKIPLTMGKDTSGSPLIEDLARMPHLLIAGTTGSGKSICVAAMILSILYTRRPDEVNLILVDPKMVELSAFKDIPHLITPVVTDMKKAPAIFDWAVKKMDERYELLARAGVRHIDDYNRLGKKRIDATFQDAEGVGGEEIPYHLPYIVVIVDELADLMIVAAKDIQNSVTRLAQKSRAVGVHVVMATQRPSVDVITGLIKSNIPARIAFQVASKVDSRTILDKNGAETLLGSGDMLFLAPGTSDLTRAQGTFVSDAEVKRVVEYVRNQGQPQYSRELSFWGGESAADGQARDELYEEAVRIVLETQRGSVSLLQRRLEIGYTRAARLIDMMAAERLVGEYKGSKAREVLVSLEDWETSRA